MRRKHPKLKNVLIRNNSYHANFKYKGERYRKSIGRVEDFSTPEEVNDAVSKYKAQIVLGLKVEKNKAKDLKLNYLIEKYLSHLHTVSKTRRKVESHLNQVVLYFRNISITQLDKAKLSTFREDKIKQGLKPRTINHYMGALYRMIEYARDVLGIIDVNPIQGYKKCKIEKQKFRFIYPDEFKSMLQSSDRYFKLILLGGYFTGMRMSEMRLLKWDNVDIVKKEITVTNTKTSVDRVIQINETLLKALTYSFKNSISDYVFVNLKGQRYKSAEAWRRPWSKCLTNSNLKHFGFHNLRRTFITNMVKTHGKNYPLIMSLSGHTDFHTLLHYVQFVDTKLKKEAVDGLSDNLFDKSLDEFN